MTRSRADNARTELIDVPPALRPSLGARTIPLDVVCVRGAEILSAVVKRNIPVLDEIALKLVEAASSPGDAERLMRCANDLRGMATTIGSEITAEIANAIYTLCEAHPAQFSRPLALLLAEAARQVIGYRRNADNGDLGARVEALLADVHARIAAA